LYDDAIGAFENVIRYTPTRGNEEDIEQAKQMIEETRQKKVRALETET